MRVLPNSAQTKKQNQKTVFHIKPVRQSCEIQSYFDIFPLSAFHYLFASPFAHASRESESDSPFLRPILRHNVDSIPCI